MNPTPTMTFDERYRAIDARDARFDGQFVTAVHTTGIYCRPSCPARTPKPQNVSFFATSAAAHEAGYRACKRCLPEATPGSPEWDLRGDVVGRAMKLIADGVVERDGVAALAGRLGYSERHLTRLLRDELGAGPLALARAQRAHTARMLLVGTDAPVAEVAFSAGFGSIRQFNDTIREVFDMTPTRLRSHRAGERPGTSSGTVTLSLPVREPFDVRGVVRWMSDRVLPGVESASETAFARTLRLPGGPAWFSVTGDASVPGRVQLRARVAHPGDLGPLVARVRRLFDLDTDPQAIDAALSAHPELAARVAAVPGIRVPGTADPHEMLIRVMIGQQITVAAARTALTRLVDHLGEPIDAPDGEHDRLFPSMTSIAERGAEVLRGPQARIRAIIETAEALASGDLVLTSADDGAQQRERLLARRGIGPWTADYARMRVIGDPDVVLPTDVAVLAGARVLGLPHHGPALVEWAHRVAPWRSYLTAHLWRANLRAPTTPSTRPQETP